MRIEYDGPVYIRPAGRGVVLGDTDVEDWLGMAVDPSGGVGWSRDWRGHMRITVEIVEDGPDGE